MKLFVASLFTTVLAVAPAFAADTPPPPAAHNAALDAALNACAGQVGKDTQGHPDRQAMDSCMQAKGFTPPAGPPPHGGPGGGMGGRDGPPPNGQTNPVQ